MTENWYLILGLEFDPNPVEDQSKVEQKIAEMVQFWSRNANHMTNGPEYRKYLKLANDRVIINALSNPTERKRQIQEACAITYGEIDKLLKIMHTAEVTDDQVAKIAANQKVSVDAVKRRVAALGMKIVVAKPIDYSVQISY